MKTAALIYSRSDSKRLPSKAFLSFGNRKLISHVLIRAGLLDVDEIILATTDRACDDQYEDLKKQVNQETRKQVKIFRGNCDDVVDRTISALRVNNIDRFCRINGDCPFFPYNIINEYMEQHSYPFINNLRERSFPYGMSVEILDSEFYINNSKDVEKNEREHTTLHLYRQNFFKQEKLINMNKLNLKNNSEIDRFVIDTKEDYEFWVGKIDELSLKVDSIFI